MSGWINPDIDPKEMPAWLHEVPSVIRTILWLDVLFGPIVLLGLLAVPLPPVDLQMPTSAAIGGAGIKGGIATTWMASLMRAAILQPVLSVSALCILTRKRETAVWFWHLVGKVLSFLAIVPAAIAVGKQNALGPISVLVWTFFSIVILGWWRWTKEESRGY